MTTLLAPLLALTLAVTTANNAQRVDVSADVRALVTSENAFAKAVQKHGVKEGFLAYLAPEAILFRPGPVQGVEWMKTRPASSGWLDWNPTFADASRSSDLGYTTGPWSYRPKGAKDQISAWGQYVTLWRKQPDGVWKVVFDGGISHPAPKSAAKSTRAGAMTAGGRVVVRPSSQPDDEPRTHQRLHAVRFARCAHAARRLLSLRRLERGQGFSPGDVDQAGVDAQADVSFRRHRSRLRHRLVRDDGRERRLPAHLEAPAARRLEDRPRPGRSRSPFFTRLVP
jgi:ketosteroid isomerase-like protein